jgi:hypothetical protein
VFLGLGLLLLFKAVRAIKTMPATFEASLTELAKDHAQLNQRADDVQ